MTSGAKARTFSQGRSGMSKLMPFPRLDYSLLVCSSLLSQRTKEVYGEAPVSVVGRRLRQVWSIPVQAGLTS